MSDIKHIEYCIKLGNMLVDKNIEENNANNNFSNINSNTEQNQSAKYEDFKTRLRNW
jgi:hypothetical protein